MTSLLSGLLKPNGRAGTKLLAILLVMFGFIPVANAAPPASPNLKLEIDDDAAVLQFSWQQVQGADYYRLMVDRDETGIFQQIGDNIRGTSTSYKARMDPLSEKEPRYRVDACNLDGCTPSEQTSEAQVRMMDAPMNQDLQNALEDLLK